jgi:hypothetical protein
MHVHDRCQAQPGTPGGLCAKVYRGVERDLIDKGRCRCSKCYNERHPAPSKVVNLAKRYGG